MLWRRLGMLMRHFVEIKYSILLAVLLFAIGIWIGLESNLLRAFIESQTEGLAQAAGQLVDLHVFWVFLFIFLNNAIKAVIVLLLGFLFGIIPMLFLIVNGMVLGYVIELSALTNGGDIGELIVRGILPHGVIELPAIIIASAYGMQFGWIVLRFCVGLLRGAGKASADRGTERRFFEMAVVLLPVLVVSLLIAAVIESTLTLWLMQGGA